VIDPYTRERLDMVKMRALHNGVNLWEALDKAGLIVTEEQMAKHWANCLDRLRMNLEDQPITALVQMGGGQNTPLDATRGILEFIDIFRRQYLAQAEDKR
jgi:hypothetical protein